VRAMQATDPQSGFALGSSAHKGGPVLIECQIPNDDASPELITWGSKVARVNARPFKQ
jgi:hypothetical protein